MASMSASVLRRALLYVPASSEKMLAKSLSLTADNITYDLEDSVTPRKKPAARAMLVSHLSGIPITSRPKTLGEVAVRINATSTPYAQEDLETVARVPGAIDAVVVPKVNSASDLRFVADALDKAEAEHSASGETPPRQNPIRLLALIESAKAVVDLREICSATPRLSGLIFAAEDFAHDLNINRTPSLTEFLYARSAIVTAARAFGLPSTIDLVCTAYKDKDALQGLERECRNGRDMGFNGKQCIHPMQLEIVQKLFSPAEEEVDWAVRIVIADQKASESGRGAWTLDGKMIDSPVVKRATAILSQAERCGFDVEGLKTKWQHQEPE